MAAALTIGSVRERLVPVAAAGAMVHARDDILEYVVAQLQDDHRDRQDPHGLLSEPFTMTELRRLHEVVLGVELQPDTFRRAMVGRLVVAEGKRAEGPWKPAGLYRRGGKKAAPRGPFPRCRASGQVSVRSRFPFPESARLPLGALNFRS